MKMRRSHIEYTLLLPIAEIEKRQLARLHSYLGKGLGDRPVFHSNEKHLILWGAKSPLTQPNVHASPPPALVIPTPHTDDDPPQ